MSQHKTILGSTERPIDCTWTAKLFRHPALLQVSTSLQRNEVVIALSPSCAVRQQHTVSTANSCTQLFKRQVPALCAALVSPKRCHPCPVLPHGGHAGQTLTSFRSKLGSGVCSRSSYSRLPATPSVVSSRRSHSISKEASTSACVDASGLREAYDCARICMRFVQIGYWQLAKALLLLEGTCMMSDAMPDTVPLAPYMQRAWGS